MLDISVVNCKHSVSKSLSVRLLCVTIAVIRPIGFLNTYVHIAFIERLREVLHNRAFNSRVRFHKEVLFYLWTGSIEQKKKPLNGSTKRIL